MPHRATKIVATLGPASSDPALLMAMITAGVNVVRLNFSHGKAEDHIARAELVRAMADKVGKTVALMADHARQITPKPYAVTTPLSWPFHPRRGSVSS